MPAEVLTGSPLAWVLRVLQVEDAPLEELSRIITLAVANVEENLAHDEVEWHRFVLYLLLFIIHRRQEAERNDLFDVVRDTLNSPHREEVDNMIYSSAQAWFDEGQQKGEQIGEQRGEQRGEQIGQVKVLLEMLHLRFGTIPEQLQHAVKALPSERISEFIRQILQVKNLDELHLD